MKAIFQYAVFVLVIFFSVPSRAQFTAAQIGVNGLTCSQCTRNVEMSLRKLDFIKDVQMNLEHTEGKIIFRDDKKIDMDRVSQAVVAAGFSLRYLRADFTFKDVSISPNYCFEYNGEHYQFIQTKPKTLNGATTLTFIGNKFLAKKDVKKWQPYMKSACGGKVYFITI